MAVTLNNIRFYHPPSLPARPTKSPNHHSTSFPRHTSKISECTSSIHSKIPLPPSQPALSHPLPARPPSINPSSHHTEYTALHSPTSTSHTAQCHPACENDFDRAFHGFFSTNDGKIDEEDVSSACVPKQDDRNDDYGQAISSDLQIFNHMTDTLPSPSFTVQESLETPANKPVQRITRNESHSCDKVNIVASTTSWESSLTSYAAKPTTSASNELDTDSTEATTQDSTQDSSVTNRQHSETPHTNGAPSHNPKSIGSTVISESADLQGGTGESERASSNQLGESSKRKRSPSACLSYPPAPLVMVSVPSRPVSLLRKSTRLRTRPSSDHLQNSDGIAGNSCESDSAPSDDENDADYSNPSRMKTAVNSLRPAKRRRRAPVKASSASRLSRRPFSKSPSAKLPESPLKDLNVESEPIPIQGFLRLRYSGHKVIYCVEFSQTDLLSSVAASQVEPAKPYQQTVCPTAKIPYTPEEDAYIMELKARKLEWDKIETLFAERFPYRKKSCLTARYYKLEPSSTRRRKRRVKSRV